ncbi:hypothetical protein, partial [Ferirhizobium litorale]
MNSSKCTPSNAGLTVSHPHMPESRPDVATTIRHLEPPAGISANMHAVNVCLSALALRIQATMRWFDQDVPDIAVARRTAANLVDDIARLEMHVARLDA